MTLDFPTPTAPTVVWPSPTNPNNPGFTAPLPPYAGFPAQVALVGLTIAQAISTGLLPTQVQVVSYTPPGGAAVSFAAYLNPTLASLISSGLIPASANVNTLAFAASANYGGN